MENELDSIALERSNAITRNVESLLANIRKEGSYRNVIDLSKHDEDVFIIYLNGKANEILKLQREIEVYHSDGKHFTKRYRTLEGHCSKLQRDLDKIDVSGRDDLASKRKNSLLNVNGLIKTLASKAHSNGIVCNDCEVKA